MDYRKMKIEYVRYYSTGTEAYKLEPKQPRRKNAPTAEKKPQPMPKQKTVEIPIDPLALIAICLTVVMVVMMFAGFSRLQKAQAELEQMEQYVEHLQNKKLELTAYFESGFNLEAVEKAARSLGAVPIAEVDHLRVVMEPGAN